MQRKNNLLEIQPSDKEINLVNEYIDDLKKKKENFEKERDKKIIDIKNKVNKEKKNIQNLFNEFVNNSKHKLNNEIYLHKKNLKYELNKLKNEYENKKKLTINRFNIYLKNLKYNFKKEIDDYKIISYKNNLDKIEIKYKNDYNSLLNYYNKNINNVTDLLDINKIIKNSYLKYKNNYYNNINFLSILSCSKKSMENNNIINQNKKLQREEKENLINEIEKLKAENLETSAKNLHLIRENKTLKNENQEYLSKYNELHDNIMQLQNKNMDLIEYQKELGEILTKSRKNSKNETFKMKEKKKDSIIKKKVKKKIVKVKKKPDKRPEKSINKEHVKIEEKMHLELEEEHKKIKSCLNLVNFQNENIKEKITPNIDSLKDNIAQPNDFIKIKNNKKNEKNDIKNENNFINNNNEINIKNNDNFDDRGKKQEYSYICDNSLLNAYIYEGTDEAKIQFSLKNNGDRAWPDRTTKLIYDKFSIISGDEINLKPQEPNETENYEVIFKNLSILEAGEYRAFILFNINGKNYGEKISMKVIIKQKDKKKELDDNIQKVKDFRNVYDLPEEDYPDKTLLEVLKRNNFDFALSFMSLFN